MTARKSPALPDRVAAVLRWEGARGLVRRSVRRALHPVLRLRRLRFLEADLTRPAPRLVARVPLEMRVVAPAELDALGPALAPLGIDLRQAREQLDRGDVLTVGFSGTALVHAGWISFSAPWIDEIGARLALGPTEACGYGAVTHPDWRGRGIQPAGALFRDEVMRSLGYTRHISWVWADNVANQRQAERGRRRTKTVWSIWVRGMRRPRVLGATVAGSPSLVRPS
jgi:GNAT superfamily N-acetyltransferase